MSGDDRLRGIARVLDTLRAAWPTIPTGPAVTAVWAAALEGLTDEQVGRAALAVVRHHAFGAPAPAHLRQAADGVTVYVRDLLTDVQGRVVLEGPMGAPRRGPWRPARVPYGCGLEQGSRLDELPPGVHELPRELTEPDKGAPEHRDRLGASEALERRWGDGPGWLGDGLARRF